MKNYHIVIAIYALEKMKENIHEQVDKLRFGTSFLEISRRETALNREREAAEALEAFKQLLTDPITTPVETPAPRPTDKDIERIRYELDRAVTIAEQVAKQSPLVAPTQPLFQVEAEMLLKSVYSALTEFTAIYPEEK